MIHFFYGFNYDSSGSDQGRTSPMLFNVKVYQIGDKYGIPKLKAQAKEKFSVAITTCWEMDDFPIAIASAYSTTSSADRGLRDLLVSTSLEHISDLLKNDDFKQVLRETLGFAADLVQSQDHPVSTVTYQCPSCSMDWSLQSSAKAKYCPLCSYSVDWRRNVKKWYLGSYRKVFFFLFFVFLKTIRTRNMLPIHYQGPPPIVVSKSLPKVGCCCRSISNSLLRRNNRMCLAA